MSNAPRILVVEDDPINLKVIICMLNKLGHTTDVARNGLEAVEMTEAKAYDIIFMDLMMPELDGIQAARKIRTDRPTAPPMIFAVTANVMPEDRREALKAGMNDYVTKPIRMETIRGLIETTPEEAEAQGMAASSDFIDYNTLNELKVTMGDAEFFAELVEEFIENSEELVNKVWDALNKDDLPGISSAAHALKSTSAAFGGRVLSDCARRAEQAVRAGQRADLPSIANQLRQERTRLCQVLRTA